MLIIISKKQLKRKLLGRHNGERNNNEKFSPIQKFWSYKETNT